MKPSVTGPGSLAMASAVVLALMPSPVTISEILGASGRPASGCTGRAKASAGRVPSAAILGTGPCAVVSENFWSNGAAEVGAGPAGALAAGAGFAIAGFVGAGTWTS